MVPVEQPKVALQPASPLPSPSPQPGSAFQPLILTADLNNDHKLDVIAQGNVFLGQGDGTFVQSSVNLPGTVLAVGDLNGDGIPDLVVYSNNVGATVYAGNGDGTFQSSPFYTAALPPLATDGIAIITDTNADGHPDLVLQSTLTSSPANTTLTVFLGDGKGNFTPDSNIYYAGSNPSPEIGFAAPVTLFPPG
jgi:FG-GAP-like repeat